MNVPDQVARMLISCHGDAGRAWLDRLPGIAAELCDRWQLRVGEPFAGGCVGYVVPAERADGSRAVLKVSLIDDETRHEADALAFWAGQGAVRMLERDAGLGAMLLERLDPGAPLDGCVGQEEALAIACRLLRRLWRPLPTGHPFPSVAALVEGWHLQLPLDFERAGRPFDTVLLDRSVCLCEELASECEPVLVNRDFHFGNILSAQREPWLLIDPKPLAGEPAFDTGYLLESLVDVDPAPAKAATLAQIISAELDTPVQRIAAWAFLRCVENALWAAGAQPAAIATYAASAEALLPLTSNRRSR